MTNAGFEGESQQFLKINDDGRGVEKPIGWSVEWYQNNNDKNGMTYVQSSFTQDSKTWNAKSGKAYFARMRWNVATLYLRQTLQDLRPGSYTLSFSAAAYSAAAGATVQVSVAGQTQTILSGAGGNADGNWTDYNISFTVTESTPYATIEYQATRGSDNLKIGIDEFSLTYDGSSYYNTILTAAQALYDDNADWAENGLSDLSAAITANSGKETVADKNAAIVALEEAMTTFKAANSVDMTAKITNPNFDSNISGWTCTGGDGNAYQRQTSTQTNFTGGFLEKWRNGWNGGYNQKNFDVSQTLSSLPNGEYTVKAYILAQMQGSKETLGDNYKDKKHGGPYYIDNEKGVWFYATSGSNSANTWANSFTPTFGDTSGGVLRSATVKVENGSLTIGFKGIGSESGGTSLGTYANWIACDTWTLSYFGFDPSTLNAQIASLKEEAVTLLENAEYGNVIGTEKSALATASTLVPANEKKSTLEAAITQIEDAINAFTAAKTNYDALVAEIAKAKALGIASATADGYAATSSSTAATALTSTQNLMVAEYDYVTTSYQYGVGLGKWTEVNITTRRGQHWDGTTDGSSGTQYYEMNEGWGSNSWTMSMNQDLTLPAGNYVLKAAGRQASGNCQLSLVVKKGEDVIGTVADFPKGDTGLGINKSGATSFNSEDAAGFANNGAGRGFQWRYVKFTLDSDATVNVAVNGEGHENYQWVSFCDATVQTDNEANISLIAYNIALNDAATAIANHDYDNVTGNERDELQDAIDADGTLDKSKKTDIDAAKALLDTKREAFIAAKPSYDAWAAVKGVTYADDKPYASKTKYTAVETAQAATPTTAADAVTAANTLVSAYRKYVESNALAEGVTDAEDKTSLISDPNMDVTYDGTAHTFGAWQVFGQTDGTINLKTEADQPLTDGDGNKYKYADIWKSDNNAGIKQTLSDLPAGKYLLTAAARAQNTADATFGLFAGSARAEIERISDAGGVFGNGWNDAYVVFGIREASDVEIGVQSGNGKSLWWGATRFRLALLPTPAVTISETATVAPTAEVLANVTLTRTLSKDYWNTFSVPFDAAIPEGWSVYEFASAEDNVINFAKATTSFEAGKPYLVKPTDDVVNPTFNNVIVQNTEGETLGDGDYKFAAQIYKKNLATDGTIAYLTTDGSVKKLNKADGLKGLRAYFIIPAGGSGARISFGDDETTGITDVRDLKDNAIGDIYDLQGRKVTTPTKGIYVVNGKKVVKK